MRSLFARLTLTGSLAAFLAGCGTNGSTLTGLPNGGGGTTNFSNQVVAGTIAGKLVDGGTTAYTGFNTTATDTLEPTAAEPTDPATEGSYDPPADVAGSHSIAYAGNGLTQQIFAFPTALDLVATAATTGAIQPVTYGAIVFYAVAPASAKSLSIELAGGSGAETYDVRSACAVTPLETPNTPTLAGAVRYVCALPAYGAASTTNIVNPVVASAATGAFTPYAAKLYVVVNDSAPKSATTADKLQLDYMYAEQGTH